ncbi:cellulose synthase complex periplasmic endoglucanase BcsZ [Limnobacter sp. MED105]|uniref:cellulose synthase complex periplasmic endoglucanase BcsZ n=1 Tax=Limnobacter sp. MED105 TaxID=391597 RepID=UPI000156C1D6|nr:cellulose synthase complex periplasmic endoglucanase BcsZ [Limnobacter sp. MED105]EDM84437.1 Cellulase [Limnobacter sp. MED105]
MALWRNCVQRLGQVAVLLAATAACSATPAQAWPAWDGFKSAFVSDDGRVIDRSQEDLRTVSEGQSYALFFALVAQDKKAFDAVLQWTENNLSAGDLGKQLPAWIWGKKGESWGVIDANSASDADLWIAYSLLEASRVWCNPGYADKARALGDLILNQESMEVSGLGLSILPGHTGFVLDNGAVKLNPSYLPPFMMARFANAWADDTRWAQVYLASQKLLLDTGRTGQYPDWVLYNNGEMSLPEDEQRGDYDAIRTYLWIAMSSESDPTTAPLLRQLSPLTALLLKRQNMPEWFEPQSGKFSATRGPAGFQAAMAPLLQTMGMPELAKKFHAQSLKTQSKESWLKYGYYNGALSLFAQGYIDKFYRFNSLGELLPRGKEVKSCG